MCRVTKLQLIPSNIYRRVGPIFFISENIQEVQRLFSWLEYYWNLLINCLFMIGTINCCLCGCLLMHWNFHLLTLLYTPCISQFVAGPKLSPRAFFLATNLLCYLRLLKETCKRSKCLHSKDCLCL